MYMTAGYMAGKFALNRDPNADWETMVRNTIFTPLGMTSSNFTIDDLRKASDFATGYRWHEQEVPHPIPYNNESPQYRRVSPGISGWRHTPILGVFEYLLVLLLAIASANLRLYIQQRPLQIREVAGVQYLHACIVFTVERREIGGAACLGGIFG
jgi:CubicO group peptidase (beta-lactamase class C family)